MRSRSLTAARGCERDVRKLELLQVMPAAPGDEGQSRDAEAAGAEPRDCEDDNGTREEGQSSERSSGRLPGGEDQAPQGLIVQPKNSTSYGSAPASLLHIQVDDEHLQSFDHFGSKFVLKQGNPVRSLWAALISMLLLYTGTVFLFRLSFHEFRIEREGVQTESRANAVRQEDGWRTLDNVMTYAFCVDLFANFFFSYEDERLGREIDSMRLIARRYSMRGFAINLIACIPQQWMYNILRFMGSPHRNTLNHGALVLRMQRVSRLAALVRLGKVGQLVAKATMQSSFQQWARGIKVVRVVNLAAALFWVVHVLACGWYLCAALHKDPLTTWVARRTVDANGEVLLLDASPLEQWATSMYFVLTVFSSVGFGDISAVTVGEISYVCIIMGIGAVVHSIIISEVIRIVTSTDKIQVFVHQQVQLIDAFLDHTETSQDAAKDMKTWIRLSARFWAQGIYSKDDMKRIITGKYLPNSLHRRLSYALYGGALAKNAIFRTSWEVPPRLPLLVALAVHKCCSGAREILYEVNDFPLNLFLVIRGTFSYVAAASRGGGFAAASAPARPVPPEAPRPLRTGRATRPAPEATAGAPSPAAWTLPLFPFQLFSSGAYFGDVELLLDQPRQATARCEKDGSIILMLHRIEVKKLSADFPHFRATWKSAAVHRSQRLARRLAKLTRGYSYRHMAAATIQGYWRGMRGAARAGVAAVESHERLMGTWGETVGRRLFLRTPRVDLHQEVLSLRKEMSSLRADIAKILGSIRSSPGGSIFRTGTTTGGRDHRMRRRRMPPSSRQHALPGHY